MKWQVDVVGMSLLCLKESAILAHPHFSVKIGDYPYSKTLLSLFEKQIRNKKLLFYSSEFETFYSHKGL
jgi:hypothetical protein